MGTLEGRGGLGAWVVVSRRSHFFCTSQAPSSQGGQMGKLRHRRVQSCMPGSINCMVPARGRPCGGLTAGPASSDPRLVSVQPGVVALGPCAPALAVRCRGGSTLPSGRLPQGRGPRLVPRLPTALPPHNTRSGKASHRTAAWLPSSCRIFVWTLWSCLGAGGQEGAWGLSSPSWAASTATWERQAQSPGGADAPRPTPARDLSDGDSTKFLRCGEGVLGELTKGSCLIY